MRQIGLKKNKALYLFILLTVFSLLLTACGGSEEPVDEAGVEDAGEEVLAMVGGEAADSGIGVGLCANQYLPVVEGATWTYEGRDTSSEAESDSEDEDGWGIYSFTGTIKNVGEDEFTYLNDFDELTQEQKWTCQPDGLLALEYTGGTAASVSVAGSEANYETSEVMGLSLPVEIAMGDTWEQSFTISGEQSMPGGVFATTEGIVTMKSEAIGEESVSVSAGDFDAIVVRTEVTIDLIITVEESSFPTLFISESTVWYVKGVGWVKSEDRAEIAGIETLGTIELQSYFIP